MAKRAKVAKPVGGWALCHNGTVLELDILETNPGTPSAEVCKRTGCKYIPVIIAAARHYRVVKKGRAKR